jgi:predicted nucleic acid-binding Zn ribbon protein
VSTWRPLRGDDDGLPKRVGESLERVAGRIGVPHAGATSLVFRRWEEIVGASLAAQCRPVSLRSGVLAIVVEDPAWATQVRWLSADILRRVEEVAGSSVATSVDVRVRRPEPPSRGGSKRGVGEGQVRGQPPESRPPD